jgi:hypothetical protein
VRWKFAISAAVMFVMLFLLGWAFHGTLLRSDYARIPNLVRPMAEVRGNILYTLLAQILTAVAFTWIYLKGREDKPWFAQGLRYGIAVAALVTVPAGLVHYAVMPFPLDLILKQMAVDVVTVVLMGLVLAWIYR